MHVWLMVNDHPAVLKKVYFSKEKTTLVSENPNFEDQVYSNNEIVIKGQAISVVAPLVT